MTFRFSGSENFVHSITDSSMAGMQSANDWDSFFWSIWLSDDSNDSFQMKKNHWFCSTKSLSCLTILLPIFVDFILKSRNWWQECVFRDDFLTYDVVSDYGRMRCHSVRWTWFSLFVCRVSSPNFVMIGCEDVIRGQQLMFKMCCTDGLKCHTNGGFESLITIASS
jgi:hypothetical protein